MSAQRHPDRLLRRLPADVRRDWNKLAGPTLAPLRFTPDLIERLPEPAQRWLSAAIEPGTELQTTVELEQHGRIDVRSWRAFRARQIISEAGYLWASSTRVLGLPVRGYDRLIAGRGDMAHRILDRFAVAEESGPDIGRSAAGRLICELCWLPAATLRPNVTWSEVDENTARLRLAYAGAAYDAEFTVDAAGDLTAVRTRRWASLHGEPFALNDFGAQIHRTGGFDGYRIPTRITAGYGFGGPSWPASAFIEIEVDRASYR